MGCAVMKEISAETAKFNVDNIIVPYLQCVTISLQTSSLVVL